MTLLDVFTFSFCHVSGSTHERFFIGTLIIMRTDKQNGILKQHVRFKKMEKSYTSEIPLLGKTLYPDFPGNASTKQIVLCDKSIIVCIDKSWS